MQYPEVCVGGWGCFDYIFMEEDVMGSEWQSDPAVTDPERSPPKLRLQRVPAGDSGTQQKSCRCGRAADLFSLVPQGPQVSHSSMQPPRFGSQQTATGVGGLAHIWQTEVRLTSLRAS